ncbi:MAG: CBS domain-containing protein [Candidatus Aenigmarchaeota archaeon]|nr:CBS domain-containing protein [Candidatus Aenigmarchaeota archaeon]
MVSAQDLMITNYPKVDTNDRISAFLGKINKSHQHWAVVFDKDKYAGMADKKLLMRSRIDIKSMKVKHCSVNSPKLAPEDGLRTLLNKFTTSDLKALPVFQGKKIVGVVCAIDILNELKNTVKKIKASEVMPKTFIAMNESDQIGKVLNAMTQKKIHHVPIIDEQGKLAGIASLEDILERQLMLPKTRIHLSGASAHQGHRQTGYGIGEKTSIVFLPVSALMTSGCCTCEPTDTLNKVISQILQHKHSSVIVANDNKPVGIVTVKDIFLKAQTLLLE